MRSARLSTARSALLWVFVLAGISVMASCGADKPVEPPNSSDYNIAVSTTQFSFLPGSEVPFTITLRDSHDQPIRGFTIGVYDNMKLICAAAAPTDDGGRTVYASQAPVDQGVYLLTFFADKTSSQYAVLIDDRSPLAHTDSIWTSEMAAGDIALGTQGKEPSSIDQLVSYAGETVVETVTSPGVIFTGLLCAGAVVGATGVTIGTLGPGAIAYGVATVACGSFLATTQTTLAFNAGKNGAKLALEQMALPPDQEQQYKNKVDQIAATYGLLIVATHIAQAPKGGSSILNYKVGTNRGSFANRYAQDFVDNLADVVDSQHEISAVKWGSVRDGDGSIVVSYAFPCQEVACSDALQSYNVVSIGFASPTVSAGTLHGYVRDAGSKLGINDVAVQATSLSGTVVSATTHTNVSEQLKGYYEFTGLAFGHWDLSAARTGFRDGALGIEVSQSDVAADDVLLSYVGDGLETSTTIEAWGIECNKTVQATVYQADAVNLKFYVQKLYYNWWGSSRLTFKNRASGQVLKTYAYDASPFWTPYLNCNDVLIEWFPGQAYCADSTGYKISKYTWYK